MCPLSVQGEGGAAFGGGGGGGGGGGEGFEFGVDPNLDPELAMALQVRGACVPFCGVCFWECSDQAAGLCVWGVDDTRVCWRRDTTHYGS